MNFVPEILLWISVLAISHSYVFFPIILKKISAKKKPNKIQWSEEDKEYPFISIILASHNEEKNIERKIISTLKTIYPAEKIEFLIGSDNSSDNTNSIIEKFSEKDKRVIFFDFKERIGKIKIINELHKKAKGEILILTDTKIFFNKDTIFNLIKHFKNTGINIVGGVPSNIKSNGKDITFQEDAYMSREVSIKHQEGLIWQNSMGVFGAIYAIRAKDFNKVPENFIVDDFYITLKVIENGGKVIFEPNAIGEQSLTGNLREEFKRKVRISAGNFQNLKVFAKLILKFNANSFCFVSHKIIRWLGPFIILTALISNFFLLKLLLYKITLIVFLISVLIPLLDYLLKKIKLNNKIIRFFTHFYTMNIALLIGYFKFLKGIKKSIWQPSVRENK